MRPPPLSENEAERLAALYDYGLLDTPSERIFDEIAELAATICGTRFAAVTLVDRERQWFKAEYGLGLTETPRDLSICGHAILGRETFEVPDTHADERFSDNPLLEGKQIRYYVGNPLLTEGGHALGMLCAMDSRPQQLSDAQKQSLRQLAHVLMAMLETGRRTRLLNWFGLLLDNIGDEILILDPDTLLYLHANRAAQEHLGFTLDEMRRLTPMDVTHDPDRAKFELLARRLRVGEPYVTFEGHRRSATGDLYPVEARWQLLSTRGKPVILSIVQDVTERRKIERMKDEFMSVVNHELRTPLTSIHGAIKLLQAGKTGSLPPQAVHLVELAAQNTQRLREIVDDILDLEKIASGRMDFDIATLSARQALERVAASYGVPAEAAGVVIRVSADPMLSLSADARRLQQVLANLVSNAVKFAPRESAVTLAAAAPHAGFVRLEVTDHGPGIPEEFRDRVFERFAQANMESSRSKGGSGLGLAIARQMVEQMGGRIGFESQPGLTRFSVDLPSGVIDAPS